MHAFRRSSTAPSSALIIGWVLYIGKDVFVPVVFSILVFYVIVGLTRLLAPGSGARAAAAAAGPLYAVHRR